MDLIPTPSRVLQLFAWFQAGVAGVCAAGMGTQPVAFVLLAIVHGAVASLLFRAADLGPTRNRILWCLATPYALWLVCWLELGWLIRLSGQAMHDPQIAAADLALFGGHGHVLFGQWFPWAGQAMQLIYLSYYGLILGPPLVLARRQRFIACDHYTHVVMTTYLLCFLAYMLFPVLGPRAVATAQIDHDGGVLGAVAEALRQTGDSPGTAFPSSHCAGAFAAALAAGKFARRRLRLVLLAWAALITISTIHTGNHYSIDAVAGVLVAIGVHHVAVRIRPVHAGVHEEALL